MKRLRSIARRTLACLLLVSVAMPNFGCAMEAAMASESAAEYESLAAPPSAMPESTLTSDSPASPPVVPANASPATKPADSRLVIYSAGYRIVVADVAGTLRSLQQSADRLGGYMQEIGGTAITFRVPASKFSEACKVVEESGEVVERQVKAQDVTEEMRDLGIRLENAEKLRQRLLDLLAKAEKVEDTLKIEAELTRIAEQIDQAKGKIRYLQSQLAMSTIRVDLNSPVTQNARGSGPKLPFSWVEDLGEGLVAGQVQQQTRKLGFFSSGPRFAPPVGFVRYYEDSSQTEAMDATGLRLRVIRQPNIDKAPLSFWSSLARKALVESRSLAVVTEEGDSKYYLVGGVRELGGKQVAYMMSAKRTDSAVVVFEAWGPKELMDRQAAVLRQSALSVDPR